MKRRIIKIPQDDLNWTGTTRGKRRLGATWAGFRANWRFLLLTMTLGLGLGWSIVQVENWSSRQNFGNEFSWSIARMH